MALTEQEREVIRARQRRTALNLGIILNDALDRSRDSILSHPLSAGTIREVMKEYGYEIY